jgi:hypothetical protein
MPCTWCGATVVVQGRRALERARNGKAYCDDEHKALAMRSLFSETMADTNRRCASERMTEHNPMNSERVRRSVSAKLRELGHKPPTQGGNGRKIPEPQRKLAEALGWRTEFVVRTGRPRRPEYPTCYKLDLAEPELMIGIEVDGGSHCALLRREQDAKKERFLEQHGWTVLRFSNQEVMADLTACVQTVMSTISRLKGTTTTLQMAS